MTTPPNLARPEVVVPRLWPDSTMAILATGPSLTQADVDVVRPKVDVVIAVSNAYRLAPWADVIVSSESKWWTWHPAARQLPALKYGCVSSPGHRVRYPAEVQAIVSSGRRGFDPDPSRIRDGHNSGYQAIHLAVHLGATTVILLGFDMQGGHFFGHHPDRTGPLFPSCLAAFPTLVAPLEARGVRVINCTRRTALTCFPQHPLEALEAREKGLACHD
jgi:hypothetical protein